MKSISIARLKHLEYPFDVYFPAVVEMKSISIARLKLDFVVASVIVHQRKLK